MEVNNNGGSNNANNNHRVSQRANLTSTSPVVLVAGPGPDGKPVIKPPEGTWIIVNPRLAGLLWKQFGKRKSCLELSIQPHGTMAEQ